MQTGHPILRTTTVALTLILLAGPRSWPRALAQTLAAPGSTWAVDDYGIFGGGGEYCVGDSVTYQGRRYAQIIRCPSPARPDTVPHAYVREEDNGRRLYAVSRNFSIADPDQGEYLYYDFGVRVGDSVPLPTVRRYPGVEDGFPVVYTDSVRLLDGTQRSRYFFEAYGDVYAVIQGIGSDAGPAGEHEGSYRAESGGCLSSYSRDGGLLYEASYDGGRCNVTLPNPTSMLAPGNRWEVTRGGFFPSRRTYTVGDSVNLDGVRYRVVTDGSEVYYAREEADGERVYARTEFDVEERLFYDLTAAVGDTIPLPAFNTHPFVAVVRRVDSVRLNNGTFRKRQVIEAESGVFELVLGIGSNAGPFESLDGSSRVEWPGCLTDFFHSGGRLYPSSEDNCDITLANPRVSAPSTSVDVYPNPAAAGSVVTIRSPERFDAYVLSDALGRVVARGDVGAGGGIDIGGLLPGTYVVQLSSDGDVGGSAATRLLVR